MAVDNSSTVDEINRAAYSDWAVVDWYDHLNLILKPERAILEKLAPTIRNKKLLDIGVGGGRTTGFLLDISTDYTGIDYVPRTVERARKKYPNANILCCDVRDLSVFQNEAFDFAMVSLSNMDYMVHEDRIAALKEIHRVLTKNGVFMFSAHNRDYRYFDKLPWQESRKPSLGHLKSCIYTFFHLPRHFRMKKHEVRSDEYAIINDSAHGFSLLTYYISVRNQIRQLEQVGFNGVEVYNMEGARIESDDSSPWFYCLAQKAP